MVESSPLSVNITAKTIAIALFGVVLLGLVDGAMPQFEMIATGGSIPVPTATIKVVFLALISLAVVWQPKSIRLDGFKTLWLVTIAYLAFDALYLATHLDISAGDIAIAYNSYYTFFLLCPLAAFVGNELSERRVIKYLFIIFVICFLIGTAQSILQKPLLYLHSTDGSFSMIAEAQGELRAFSLFASPLAYGTYCCLIGAISLSLFLVSRSRKLAVFFFLCAAVGCYSTLTRNAYVQFLCACLSAYLLANRKMLRLVRYLPILFLILSILITWRGSAGGAEADSAVTSNLSLLMRLGQWIYYLTLYSAAPLVEKILGLGVVQAVKASNDAIFIVDNQYLAVLLDVGMVGFILIFWLQWKMWILTYKRAIASPSVFTIAVAGFWSVFLSVYFFNISLATFSLVFMGALIVRPDLRASKQAAPREPHLVA